MRQDLDHLTVAKRQEIARVTAILVEEFEVARARRTARYAKDGRILKVVLFGSYARGDWVADNVGGYFSDFDVLVIVNDERLTEPELWHAAEDRLAREIESGGQIRTPVNLIVHDLADLNSRLRRGRPFFADIARDGVLLLDTPGYTLDIVKPLSPAAAHEEAREQFAEWFPGAMNFLQLARQASASGMPKEAAFLLHQSAERLYHCLLLVLTLYSPKSHKLRFLRSQAERLAPALIEAWPRQSRSEQRCFELLRRAYVDARYSAHYRISQDELDWLLEHVDDLGERVRHVCEVHLGASL